MVIAIFRFNPLASTERRRLRLPASKAAKRDAMTRRAQDKSIELLVVSNYGKP